MGDQNYDENDPNNKKDPKMLLVYAIAALVFLAYYMLRS